MATKVRKSSSLGAGCLLQFLGLVCFVVALLTLATIIGPVIFGIAGIALISLGSSMARWWACSDCGTKLADKSVKVCPGCRSQLT